MTNRTSTLGCPTSRDEQIRTELDRMTLPLTASGPLTIEGWRQLTSQIQPGLLGRLLEAVKAARADGFFSGTVAEAKAAGAVTEYGSVYIDRQLAATG